MNRSEFIYMHKLMSAGMTVHHNKTVYDEPWDRTNKDHLLPVIKQMTDGFKEHNLAQIVSAGGDLSEALKKIVKTEYRDRVELIRYDMEYIKNNITFMEFDDIAYMINITKDLEKATPEPQDVVSYLAKFNNVHDYYYYKKMVDSFIASATYYAQFAAGLGKESEADSLFNMVENCNRPGNRYVDSYNLYYFTDIAQSLVDKILQTF